MRILAVVAAAIICTALFPATGFAQSSSADAPADYTLLGAGLRSRPAYDGSRAQKLELVPVVRYYRGLLFARTTQGMLEGGARMDLAPWAQAGVQLAYEQGRESSESGFLRERNVPDVDRGASIGAHLEMDFMTGPVPLSVLMRLRQNVQTDRGSQFDLRLTAGIYKRGPLGAAVFGQATWASARALRTYYGAPGFDPSGGLLFTSLGIQGGYELGRHWMVVASAEGRHLGGDAATSPLVERRTNYYASAGLAYRF
jgi:outer membrane scaffolding protein for murein synthesis (MipA/OmpV family)